HQGMIALVAPRRHGLDRGMGLTSVALRVDIEPAAENETIAAIEEGVDFLRGQRGKQERQATRGEDGIEIACVKPGVGDGGFAGRHEIRVDADPRLRGVGHLRPSWKWPEAAASRQNGQRRGPLRKSMVSASSISVAARILSRGQEWNKSVWRRSAGMRFFLLLLLLLIFWGETEERTPEDQKQEQEQEKEVLDWQG